MNEATEKLIRELAEKLGTTADHLWGVLCRQAIISGVTNLIVLGVWFFIIVWGYKIVARKTKCPPKTETNPYPVSEWNGEGVACAWLVWGFLAGVSILIAGLSLEYVVGSLLNPEYWALNKIVK